MNFRKDDVEQAVSPVVGVMLMLVVTIIIAAVVSAFAGGLSGDTKKAPQAVIDANIKYNVADGMGDRSTKIDFKLVSGDPLPTKDLSIITYYTNSSGITLKHEQTPSSHAIDLYAGTSSAGHGYTSRVPALYNVAKGWAFNEQQHFGNYSWVAGDIISTGGDPGTADLLGMSGDWDGSLLDPDFRTGSIVDIKILHVPSSKYLFDKEVVVS